jgi:hypothetical protein
VVATVVAALHGVARRRAHVRAVLGTGKGANGPSACAVQQQAKIGRCGGGAVVQRARPGGAAAVERRRAWSGRKDGLRSTTSSAKSAGEGAGAHRGLGLAGETAQSGRRRGSSGGNGSESGKKLL